MIMADFKVTADSEHIDIDGLRLAPAEADNLKAAVSFAGAMRDVENLPPQIDYEQFVVQFFEDGTLIVDRADGASGAIKFSFNTVDTLVQTVESALGISVDAKRLRPSPRSVGDPGFLAEGDIIEGR
jgi:hypothetical protein